MNNTIQIIKEQEVLGKQFTVYGDFENPMFLSKDMTEWIEYDGLTSQLINTVNDNEKQKTNRKTIQKVN